MNFSAPTLITGDQNCFTSDSWNQVKMSTHVLKGLFVLDLILQLLRGKKNELKGKMSLDVFSDLSQSMVTLAYV